MDTFKFLMSSKNHLPDELSPASLEVPTFSLHLEESCIDFTCYRSGVYTWSFRNISFSLEI